MRNFILGGLLVSSLAACSSTTEPICGDGIVDPDLGETCDHGSANGAAGDSCSASCQLVGGELGHIVANWEMGSVDSAGNVTAAACPSGFDTAALHTVAASSDGTALDPCTTANANCFIDLFNCSDKHGVSAPLPATNYLTWITITSHDGSSKYATSVQEFVDITNVDMNFGTSADPIVILVDGGYFRLSWSLMGETSGNPLTCSQTAAATSQGGSVEVTSTINGTATALSDKFNCEDHFGYSAPLPTDTYTVVMDALNSNDQALGTSSTTVSNNAVIGNDPNTEIVDLGHVILTIAGQ